MTSTAPGTSTPAATEGTRERNARGSGGRLRADILTAAAELLDETGDERAVTLRAIARRVGVTAPALYTHFSDRQEILLAVVREAFTDLDEALRAATAPAPGTAGSDVPPGAAGATRHLRAVCAAYLDYAAARPQRYRVMFGGLWNAADAVTTETITPTQARQLGQDALAVLTDALQTCVDEGASTSTDPTTDAVALWLGLHGLAHQRAVIPHFPWPPGIADHLVTALAHLTPTTDHPPRDVRPRRSAPSSVGS